MSLVINGKTYKTVYLNGKEYSRGYLNGRPVFTRAPDNNSYLWADQGVRIAADSTSAVSYLNTPRVISNALSNQTLDQSPFELQFDVHSKTITQGTTQILNADGLMRCFAQDGTLYFKFVWGDVVYAMDKRYIKDGWNTVILSSTGKIISLQVNEYVAILVDTSKVTTKSVWYSGFTSSRYISLKQPFGSYQKYDIIIPVLVADNTTTQPVVAKSNADVTMYMQGSSKCLRIYPSGTVMNSTVMENGKYYWTRCVYDGSRTTVYIAADDHSMNPQELPIIDSAFWIPQAYASDDKFSGNAWHIGHNGGTSYYWHSSIDIGRSLITTDGEVFADGTIAGSFSSKFDFDSSLARTEREYGPSYPVMSVGQISSQVDWTKVRNIKAVVL